ncbi:hypothetical protein Peur_047756 [Populus x canadensis]
MGSEEGSTHWSVFEGVRNVASSNPETLMSEIETAINELEYSRSTALLDSPSQSSTHIVKTNMSSDSGANPQYDAKMADGTYMAGCAALAAGKLDEALQYLNVSLSKCPPDKTSAVVKLQSLISLTSQQLHLTLSFLYLIFVSVSEQSFIFGYTRKKIISDVGVATSDRFSICSLLEGGKLSVLEGLCEVKRSSSDGGICTSFYILLSSLSIQLLCFLR